MRNAVIGIFVFTTLISQSTQAQLKSGTEPIKWITWALLQTIPSPGYLEDRNKFSSSLKFSLSWNITPLSYSFGTNSYLSPLSFFYIKPQKRFSGSAEIFLEPLFITGTFKHSELKKFHWKTGGRIVFPIAQKGEYLSFSLGAGYYNQRSNSPANYKGIFYEGAVYTFFGMLGLKFSYNHKGQSRYQLGLYLKYY